MTVDRNCKYIPRRCVDDSESVSSALNNVDDVEWDIGSAVVSSNTVECSAVGDWDNTSRNVASEQRKGGVVPPVTNLPNLMGQIRDPNERGQIRIPTVFSSSTSYRCLRGSSGSANY